MGLVKKTNGQILSVEGITANRTSISRLSRKINGALKTIWENWKAWSDVIQNPLSFEACSGFPTSQYVTFSNDGSYKIMSVTCNAYVLCHGDLSEDDASATVTATIKGSNDNKTWIDIKESTSKAAERVKGATAMQSVSCSWDDGCPYKYIRCYTSGTSFKRYVVATLTGFNK